MTVSFHAAASDEFTDAVAFYDAAKPGLGRSFIDAVEAAVRRISERPRASKRVARRRDVRRAMVRDFPFSVVYEFVEGHVRIIAIAHHQRKPDYWRGRI